MVEQSRTKNMVVNISTSIFLQVINMIVGFIIPQLFLKQYGSEYYGLISSVQQILAYLTIFEAGIGMASIQSLYSAINEKNYTKINSILLSTKKFYNRAALFYSVGLIIMTLSYPFLINSDINKNTVALLVIVMGSSSVIEYIIQGKYRVILTADQKLSVVNKFMIISQLLGLIIRLILISLGVNIIIVQSSLIVINFLRGLILGIYVRKNYKFINLKSNGKIQKLSQKNAVLINQISGLVVYNSPTILLTFFADLKMVSVYSVYNFVFSSLYSILTNTFSTASTASFGSLISSNNLKSLQTNYNLYEFIYYNLVTVVYSVTAIMIIPFVRIYTFGINDIEYVDYKLVILFLIIGILNNIRVPMVTMINAAGHFEQTKKRAIIEAIINFSASLFFVKYLGIYGVLIGALVSFMYRSIDMIIYSNKNIVKQSNNLTIKRILINIIIGCILYITINRFMGSAYTEIDSWISWIGIAIITTIICTLVVISINALIEPQKIKGVFSKVLKLSY